MNRIHSEPAPSVRVERHDHMWILRVGRTHVLRSRDGRDVRFLAAHLRRALLEGGVSRDWKEP